MGAGRRGREREREREREINTNRGAVIGRVHYVAIFNLLQDIIHSLCVPNTQPVETHMHNTHSS